MKATPIQVLHVVGGTGCGGTETWLTSMLGHAEAHDLSMSFLVHSALPGYYDDLIREHGGSIHHCLHHRSVFQYSRHLRSLLKSHRFDIIHSHVSSYSGLILRIARHVGIPTRIAHSHHIQASRQGWPRRIYAAWMHRWIRQNATHKLAASEQAVTTLAGSGSDNSGWRVLHCGINLQPYQQSWDRQTVLKELKIDSSAKILGHVGRFVPEKNHRHLLTTFRELARRDERWHLLLIGDGPERLRLEQQVADLQLTSQIRFLGIRSDIPRLLKSGMDLFVFPSAREGLGLSLVEAQAAGLRCVTSTAVPEEASVIPELVTRLPLAADHATWAETIAARATEPIRITSQQAWTRVSHSDFNLSVGIKRLRMIYQEAQNAAASLDYPQQLPYISSSAIAS